MIYLSKARTDENLILQAYRVKSLENLRDIKILEFSMGLFKKIELRSKKLTYIHLNCEENVEVNYVSCRK